MHRYVCSNEHEYELKAAHFTHFFQFEVEIQQNHSARKRLLTPPNSSPKSPDDGLGNRRKRRRSCSDDEEWTPQYKSPNEPLKRKVDSPSSSKLSKKVPARVPVILESFGRSQGAGEQLQDLLPNHQDNADGVAAFLLFVYERQMIWKRKYGGKRQTLTKNNVLSTQWFTNMYR